MFDGAFLLAPNSERGTQSTYAVKQYFQTHLLLLYVFDLQNEF